MKKCAKHGFNKIMNYTSGIILFLILSFPIPAFTNKSMGNLNVLDFGAKADGKTDDTKAFQNTLDQIAKDGLGGIVSVPQGVYLISGHLSIPENVILEGVWNAPSTGFRFQDKSYRGTTLLAVENEGKPEGTPFITLTTNSTIKGITIYYPNQTDTNPPKKYPWTIASNSGDLSKPADCCSIIDVNIVNPYQAVDFGSFPTGRHYIRNLYGQPLYKGLFVNHCYDVGRVENVHFWPFWVWPDSEAGKYVAEHGEAFIIGRSDWQYMSGCFCFGYKIGYHLVASESLGPGPGGPGNPLLLNSGADACQTALLVETTQAHAGATFLNGQFLGSVVIKESNTGPIKFSNCAFYNMPDTKELISTAGTGNTTFTNCHFWSWDAGKTGAPAIHAKSGGVTVTACEFMDKNKKHFVLDTDVDSAIIMGNRFRSDLRIENKSGIIIQQGFNSIDKKPEWSAKEGEIIIDDSDYPPLFKTEGKWFQGSGGRDFRDCAQWATKGSGEAKAWWNPDLPKKGTYEVYVWYGGDPNNDHATNAGYIIKHKKGTDIVILNQKTNFGKWVLLGDYEFEKGDSGNVTLTNQADGNVLADAVKWIKK